MQKTGWFCLAVPSLCRLHIAPTRESPTVSDIGEKDQLVEVVLQYPQILKRRTWYGITAPVNLRSSFMHKSGFGALLVHHPVN
jgi:hypothetical protein